MFSQIDPTDLARVSGGQARCPSPRYVSNADEVARRGKMTAAQRKRADADWARTFASLTPERQQAIRNQAALNANTGDCKVAEPILRDQMLDQHNL